MPLHFRHGQLAYAPPRRGDARGSAGDGPHNARLPWRRPATSRQDIAARQVAQRYGPRHASHLNTATRHKSSFSQPATRLVRKRARSTGARPIPPTTVPSGGAYYHRLTARPLRPRVRGPHAKPWWSGAAGGPPVTQPHSAPLGVGRGGARRRRERRAAVKSNERGHAWRPPAHPPGGRRGPPPRDGDGREAASLDRVDCVGNHRFLERIGNMPPAEAQARGDAAQESTALAAPRTPDRRRKTRRSSPHGDRSIGGGATRRGVVPHIDRVQSDRSGRGDRAPIEAGNCGVAPSRAGLLRAPPPAACRAVSGAGRLPSTSLRHPSPSRR